MRNKLYDSGSMFFRPPERVRGARARDVCRRHVARYRTPPDEEEITRVAAKKDRLPIELESFECPTCGYWHIGRKLILVWLERQRLRRSPMDITMMDAIGKRAHYCGQMESIGPERRRIEAITKRGESAQKRREKMAA